MSCEIILKWQSGQPELVGLYFVAVKYGPGAGEFQFAKWNGESWELQPNGDIEALVDIQSFKNQLSIQWPQLAKGLTGAKSQDSDPWKAV